MTILGFSRGAFGICAAAAMLAACGGSQPPIGAPGAMPQAHAIATHASRGSWMLSEARSEDLIYTSDLLGKVYVLSYPGGKLVGTLTGFFSPTGECVDGTGNVWITNASPPEVIEYAHGGTTPIATLPAPSGEPNACSVDPTTGNLAVTDYSAGTIAVYQNAQGTPTTYSNPDFGYWYYCAYDNNGNLFAGDPNNSNEIAELQKGSDALTGVTLSQSIAPGSMQWDGHYLAIDNLASSRNYRGPTTIERVQVSGTTGTVIGSTLLTTRANRRETQEVQYWIQGKMIIGPDSGGPHAYTFNLWRYPAGGAPTKVVRHVGKQLWGVTVSLAPRH